MKYKPNVPNKYIKQTKWSYRPEYEPMVWAIGTKQLEITIRNGRDKCTLGIIFTKGNQSSERLTDYV